MGFFSWKTNDTERSIANKYSNRSTFTVYMRDNEGNVWVEENYEGYGEFGGKDYYELLAEKMQSLQSGILGVVGALLVLVVLGVFFKKKLKKEVLEEWGFNFGTGGV